jgi:hypothetical protein
MLLLMYSVYTSIRDYCLFILSICLFSVYLHLYIYSGNVTVMQQLLLAIFPQPIKFQISFSAARDWHPWTLRPWNI